jgi:hypothetical protein
MNDTLYIIKRKPKKYRTIRPVSKSNRKIVTSGKIATPNTHIQDSLTSNNILERVTQANLLFTIGSSLLHHSTYLLNRF